MNELLKKTQRAIVITAAGGPDVLQEQTTSILMPQHDEVLIRVYVAGVNRHDCNQRRRGPSLKHSDIPGLEVAGEVLSIGSSVKNLKIGDRVCALTDGGGYAQYAIAPASHCFHMPTTMDYATAAALPEALFTIWHNFFNVAQLAPGESVLIHGGTSGVGTIAIQVLTQLGHQVFVTCGTDHKAQTAEKLGAKIAFNYHTHDFAAEILKHTEQRGVDVILDMSGGRYSLKNLHTLAMRGRLVHLSPGDGTDFQVPLRDIMAKEAKITGSLLRPLPNEEKTLIAHQIRKIVWPLVCKNLVVPLIYKEWSLQEAMLAHAEMEAGEHIGKLILRCNI